MKSGLTKLTYRVSKMFAAHQAFVVVICVLMVLLAVFMRITTLDNLPIDQDYLTKKTAEVKPVKFNEEAIEKIKALSESNVVDPGTQLPSDRQNPFSE